MFENRNEFFDREHSKDDEITVYANLEKFREDKKAFEKFVFAEQALKEI